MEKFKTRVVQIEVRTNEKVDDFEVCNQIFIMLKAEISEVLKAESQPKVGITIFDIYLSDQADENSVRDDLTYRFKLVS